MAIHKRRPAVFSRPRRWPLSGERITTGFTVSTKAGLRQKPLASETTGSTSISRRFDLSHGLSYERLSCPADATRLPGAFVSRSCPAEQRRKHLTRNEREEKPCVLWH